MSAKLKEPIDFSKALITTLMVLAVLASIAVFCLFWKHEADATKLYDESLRQSMFTGFLTLGGFLLSMKTFILVNIKKGVYESDVYLKEIEKAVKSGQHVDRYGSLFSLQKALSLATAFAIFVSLSQFTLGLLPWWPAKAFAASLAVFAFSFVAWAFWLLYMNTKRWFKLMEDEETERRRGNGSHREN